jgi:hypothetical protein
VSQLSYLVFVAGLVLEMLLVWRLLVTGLWRRYSFVFIYILYVVVVQTLFLYAVLKWAPGTYARWYWITGTLNLGLRFLLIWEVFRNTFPANSPLRRIVSHGFTIIAVGVITLVTAMLWGIETYGKSHSLPLALERSFGFAQAVLILTILFAARYYQRQLGRNMWGIAVAFGMYSSLATTNSALLDLVHSLLPYWRVLGPLSLVAMVGMWTWAVWVYAPNPAMIVDESADADAVRQWSEDWGRTVSGIRKVMNP